MPLVEPRRCLLGMMLVTAVN